MIKRTTQHIPLCQICQIQCFVQTYMTEMIRIDTFLVFSSLPRHEILLCGIHSLLSPFFQFCIRQRRTKTIPQKNPQKPYLPNLSAPVMLTRGAMYCSFSRLRRFYALLYLHALRKNICSFIYQMIMFIIFLHYSPTQAISTSINTKNFLFHIGFG